MKERVILHVDARIFHDFIIDGEEPGSFRLSVLPDAGLVVYNGASGDVLALSDHGLGGHAKFDNLFVEYGESSEYPSGVYDAALLHKAVSTLRAKTKEEDSGALIIFKPLGQKGLEVTHGLNMEGIQITSGSGFSGLSEPVCFFKVLFVDCS